MKKFLSVLLCAVLFVGSALVGTAANGEIKYGDVDGTGGITSGDARLVLRYSVGLEELDEYQLIAADVDGSGVVNAGDARMILRGSVGLEATSNFGINGSQVFMSGNFVLTATLDEETGTKFTISQTNNSSYMEATIDVDMSDGSTNTGKPVRIGFLTVGEKVYWVLPDADPICYLLIDEKVTANMGVDADMFKELIPQIMTSQTGRTPDVQTTVTINGMKYNRWIYENEDGSSVAHDSLGITLRYIRTFDAEGNETSVMRVNSISSNVPEYQTKLKSGSVLYASEEGDAEDDIGYITAFLFKFAALANIPTDDLLG